MAKQAGPLFITGTIDNITFYKMEGQYLARKKSSLNHRQFRTDHRFARSRKSAKKFGEASKLASEIYHQLPKAEKKKGVFGKLTNQVGCLLRDGIIAEEIIKYFLQQYQPAATKSSTSPRTKETAKTPTHISTWKITPSGKLLGPMLKATQTASPCIRSSIALNPIPLHSCTR